VALIVVNVGLWLLTALAGGSWQLRGDNPLLGIAANHGPATAAGQWWRLLSYAFIHWNLLHLTFNCASLAIFGSQVERIFGSANYLFVYLASAVGAGAASLWWRPEAASGGASGAIFGIAGALLVVLYLGTAHLPRQEIFRVMGFWILFVLYGLGSGLLIPGVDNAAHLGGLATGAALAWILVRALRRGRPRMESVYVGSILSLILVAALAINSVDTAWTTFKQVTQRLRDNDVAAALEVLGDALARQPDSLALQRLHGRLLIGAGHYDRAITALSRASARHPKQPELKRLLGMAYLGAGQGKRAITALEAALALSPRKEDTRYQLGVAYAMGGQRAQALDAFGDLVGDGPQSAAAHSLLAEGYLQLGELDAASQAAAEALAIDPDSATAHGVKGQVLRAQGRDRDALVAFQRFAELAPTLPTAWIELSESHYLVGDFEHALVAAQRAIRLAPRNPGAHDALVAAKLWQGDLAGAKAAAQELLRLAPDHAGAVRKLGFIELLEGRYHEALSYLRVEPLPPSESSIYRGLWWSLAARGAGEDRQAESVLAGLASALARGTWPHRLVQYLHGDITSATLLDAAVTAGQRCEAHFYVAFRALLDGDDGAALSHLEASAATGVTPYFEHLGATVLLRRLAAPA
jgi:rhomboid protease GluP